MTASLESAIRAIAFYLPQFHPVPENDEWWGKGFTEWRNVARARPQFPGHYQPHLPADLGFYDLRLPESRQAQAELARAYGLHGFCYYHYWFNGRRILERPFNEVLASGKPDFPFCLCWANENWTRIWDGGKSHILLEQKHSWKDDRLHMESLLPAFRDERYIRVDGKPLFLVYRTGLLPDPSQTAEIWREVVSREGLGDIYLVRVESHDDDINPSQVGFDASVEFAPYGVDIWGRPRLQRLLQRVLSKMGFIAKGYVRNHVVNYDLVVEKFLGSKDPGWVRLRGVTPSWDNSARRDKNALILRGSAPDKYENWLKKVVQQTVNTRDPDKRLVFINAWNEWAEGNHLEPDQEFGHAYLEATRRALASPIS